MYSTPKPIATRVRLPHPSNALSSTLRTPLGSVSSTRFVHSMNAFHSMFVTVPGSEIPLREPQ